MTGSSENEITNSAVQDLNPNILYPNNIFKNISESAAATAPGPSYLTEAASNSNMNNQYGVYSDIPILNDSSVQNTLRGKLPKSVLYLVVKVFNETLNKET